MDYQRKRSAFGRRRRTGAWQSICGGLLWLLGRRQARPYPASSLYSAEHQRFPNRRFSLAGLHMPCMLLGLALLGGWTLHQLCHWNIFRVTELRLEGAHTLSEGQVLGLGGLEQGLNLVTLNTGRIERQIATHPWVAGVQVKRQWPSGVLVELHEYVPFALLNQVHPGGGSQLSYIDYDGHVIAEVPEGGGLDYPVINGAGPDDIADGRLVTGGAAERALQILHLAARGNALLPLQSVSEVYIGTKKDFTLYLAEHPFPIHFGRDHLEHKFNELLHVLKQLYDSGDIGRTTVLEMGYGDDVNKMLCRSAQSK